MLAGTFISANLSTTDKIMEIFCMEDSFNNLSISKQENPVSICNETRHNQHDKTPSREI
jgi:hypothetical protein